MAAEPLPEEVLNEGERLMFDNFAGFREWRDTHIATLMLIARDYKRAYEENQEFRVALDVITDEELVGGIGAARHIARSALSKTREQ